MKDDFIVPLNGLAQGRTAFRWSAGKEFFERFENSEILDAGLDVRASVEKEGRRILLDCWIEGNLTVICDRCLADLEIPVGTDFCLSLEFGHEDSETREGREVVILPEGATEYDLSQTVYDYVCLSLPVQRIHAEGGCDPDTVRFLSSENNKEEPLAGERGSTPFAGLKDLLKQKEI